MLYIIKHNSFIVFRTEFFIHYISYNFSPGNMFVSHFFSSSADCVDLPDPGGPKIIIKLPLYICLFSVLFIFVEFGDKNICIKTFLIIFSLILTVQSYQEAILEILNS